jgi:hypothetical protein
MKPDTSQDEFRLLLGRRDLAGKQLTAADALSAMAEFYLNHRAEGCDLGDGGDMLLYQWGIYGFGRPKSFQFDITRQFIFGDGEDDEIFQLQFTLHYPVSEEVQAIKAGNRWCDTPKHLAEFESFIRHSAAFQFVAARLSDEVQIRYGCAG